MLLVEQNACKERAQGEDRVDAALTIRRRSHLNMRLMRLKSTTDFMFRSLIQDSADDRDY